MQGATLEELRDLSRRSRRTLAWGALAVTASLVMLPTVFTLADLAPGLAAWAATGAVLLGGLLFLKFAHAAGQERGEFRRLFRQAKRNALDRTLTPTAPAPATPRDIEERAA